MTLALLGLAVRRLYPRLPAGARAALAAVLGALALEGAVLAVSATPSAVGARGEDWTGFLLVPIGLVLLVLAAVPALALAQAGQAALAPPRRARVRSRSSERIWLVVPVAMAILSTHRPRAAVEQVSLGRPYEQVTAADERRPPARRLVCPLAQRRSRDLLPDA